MCPLHITGLKRTWPVERILPLDLVIGFGIPLHRDHD